MNRYTLKFLGFNEQQKESVAAILSLADSALNAHWIVTDTADSDAVILNLDNVEGQQIFQAQQLGLPSYRIILVSENPDSDQETYWFLTKKRNAPPSLKELAKLLNEVATVLAETSATPSQQASPDNEKQNPADSAITETTELKKPITTAQEKANDGLGSMMIADTGADQIALNPVKMTRPLYPRNYFFGTLLQAKKDNACRIVGLKQLPNLYLSPADGDYYFQGKATELLEYCTAKPQFLKESITTKQKFQNNLKKEELAKAQPFDSLFVLAILEASQGRLLEGHSGEQTIKLRQLPDINKLPMMASYTKIANHIHQQPCSLFECAETLQIPLSSLYNFYNVCFLLDYFITETESSNKTETIVSDTKKPSKLSQFLKDLFNK